MIVIKRKPPAKKLDNHGVVIPGPPDELPYPEGTNTWKCWGTVGTILAVDPGLGGTGWATFDRANFDDLVPPTDSGSIDSTEDIWWRKCHIIADQLHGIARRSSTFVIYIEQAAFMESAGRGLAAARDGDLVKLAILTGIIAGRVTDMRSVLMCPVPVRTWKGSMPKDVCAERIRRKLPTWKPKTKTTHEIDAVGIGLFVKGHFQ